MHIQISELEERLRIRIVVTDAVAVIVVDSFSYNRGKNDSS
ncbi:MAG TPA: hypothetical protein VHJ38_02670 [Nitrososphaeraceae archaeon]|nr:hypothetical protein [Nitrososphaeraceae archaeon]